jgi:hypothetical protein
MGWSHSMAAASKTVIFNADLFFMVRFLLVHRVVYLYPHAAAMSISLMRPWLFSAKILVPSIEENAVDAGLQVGGQK